MFYASENSHVQIFSSQLQKFDFLLPILDVVIGISVFNSDYAPVGDESALSTGSQMLSVLYVSVCKIRKTSDEFLIYFVKI